MITPHKIKQKLERLALVDAIISPEWEYRYFSFDAHWSDYEQMASMRSGQGDNWFVWFKSNLMAYKCFSHEESYINHLPKIKSSIPTHYQIFINEPAFTINHSTCIWYLEEDKWVKFGTEPQQVETLDKVLLWTAKDYQLWAQDYYEINIPLDAIEKIFSGEISFQIANQLNPNIDKTFFQEEVTQAGISLTK